MKNKILQLLIDFAENRTGACQKVAKSRCQKYGCDSWQWMMTVWQEIFWYKFSCRILRRI
jgi:hypothetical protein